MRPSIHAFIISWAGQHEQAVHISKQIEPAADHVSLIFSDPNPQLTLDCPGKTIRRPNHLFWADKFQACLADLQMDYMLVIHADCTCSNWAELIYKCKKAIRQYPQIGVWAPLISGTPFELSDTHISDVDNSSLTIAAQTDGLVFCLSPKILQRMKQIDYRSTTYGWGINWIFCCHAFTCNQLVVIDRSIEVDHPGDLRGYDPTDARQEMNGFLSQQTLAEKVQHSLLDLRIEVNRNEKRLICGGRSISGRR